MPDHAHQVLTELLVLRAQQGHADAIDLLLRAWQDRLLRHARRMTGGEQEGLDVMQECWLSVIRGLGRLDDPARFGPWAYQIVTRHSVQWIRRQHRQRRAEGELAVQDKSSGDANSQAEAEDEVRVALRRLPPDQKAILELRYVESFSIDQIAEALDIAAGTVKSRLFHARQQLRQILERIRS
jgi:RNA polymerase sigma-70 factor (ECF subfamily)